VYRGFVDAGWFLDIPTYDNSTTSFQEISKSLLNIAHVIYDKYCVSYYAATNEIWKCFHAQYIYTLLTTPLIFNEFLYDAANLGFDGVGGPPYDASKQKYVNQFRGSMTVLTRPLENIFSAACFKHETEDTNLYDDVHVNGVSLSTAVGSWFFTDKPGRYVDTCPTINCNPTC